MCKTVRAKQKQETYHTKRHRFSSDAIGLATFPEMANGSWGGEKDLAISCTFAQRSHASNLRLNYSLNWGP